MDHATDSLGIVVGVFAGLELVCLELHVRGMFGALDGQGMNHSIASSYTARYRIGE